VPSVRPPLTDDGTSVFAGFEAVRTWGIPPRKTTAATDSDPVTVNNEPSLELLAAARKFRILGPRTITSFGSERVAALRAAIDSKQPVVVSLIVDKQVDGYGPGVPVGAFDPTKDRGRGLHAVYCYGYRVNTNGSLVFIFRNSWGERWGDKGDFEGDESFVETLAELHPVVAVENDDPAFPEAA
jgi:hypothetical protein